MAKRMRLEREAAVKYTADPEKAERLQALGYVITDEEEVETHDSAPAALASETAPENPEVTTEAVTTALTVAEIQERLTVAGVAYPSSAKKDMLISIAEANGVVL